MPDDVPFDTYLYGQRNLTEMLRWRAQNVPELLAYRFSKDGSETTNTLTYGQLYARACAIASFLLDRSLSEKAVLLWYSAGPEFLEAFLGCMIAGAYPVAIPLSDSLTFKRTLPRFKAIAEKARASTLLSNSTDESWAEYCPVAHRVNHNTAVSQTIRQELPERELSSIAFLQFTSGSTSTPKGIPITHANLLHQLTALAEVGQYDARSVIVNWMPHFHDYGLVSGLLLPIYLGVPCVAMPPSAFLRKPLRWLELIASAKGTHSCGPPFAFDYCCKSLTPEDVSHLKLECWRDAGMGAEPIHAGTLLRFARLLEGTGFQLRSMSPAYGLAENTLAASYTRSRDMAVFKEVDAAELAANRITAPKGTAVTLVASGQIIGFGTDVRVVDPQTLCALDDNSVGEIWIASGSVAPGYWEDPVESERVFGGHIVNGAEGRFLRTGDLGFRDGKNLFVTGRLKDLIILAGQNHYPQDLERIAEASHPDLRPQSCVAFSTEEGGEEKITILAEARAGEREAQEIARSIRQAIGEQYGADVYRVAVVKPGSISKTSSGKVQRRDCKESYVAGRVKVQFDDAAGPRLEEVARKGADASGGKDRVTAAELRAVVRSVICAVLRLSPTQIDDNEPIASYGAASLQLTRIAVELGQRLGRIVSPVLLYENGSIHQVADALARRSNSSPQTKVDKKSYSESRVAITGAACHFPSADSPREFWELLQAGQEAIVDLPEGRWNVAKYAAGPVLLPGQMITSRGGYLRDVKGFDRKFFGISKREAENMDPQQRLLLETTWEALEDAGVNPLELRGTRVGVYVAISNSDYGRILAAKTESVSPFAGAGGSVSIAANRISYWFGFEGPSMVVDTACSSSLVALHLACESLRRGEIDTAVVGAANLILLPELTVALSQAGFLSPEARCKTLDASADGYVRSEGCGVVVLTRLGDAETAGLRIQGVIEGSAVNQDGRSNGLTAPNPRAQRQVIAEALENASKTAADVTYIEAHGTGTALGDAIEMSSIVDCLGDYDGTDEVCFVGSVKANVGHLEAAAGMAGLLKVIKMMEHEAIPAQIGITHQNPNIHLDGTRVRVAAESTPWRVGLPKIAGISSFGFGGTNAHVVISGYRQVQAESRHEAQLLTLSAKTPEALQETVERYVEYLAGLPGYLFGSFCYTANVGRPNFTYRVAVVASSCEEAVDQLVRAKAEGAGPTGRELTLHSCGGEWGADELLGANSAFRTHYQRVEANIGPEAKQWPTSGVIPEYAMGMVLQDWGIALQPYTGSGCGKLAAGLLGGDRSLFQVLLQDMPEDVDTSAGVKAAEDSEIVLTLSAGISWQDILRLAAKAYMCGSDIVWQVFYSDEQHRRTQVPTYPFQREKFWIDAQRE